MTTTLIREDLHAQIESRVQRVFDDHVTRSAAYGTEYTALDKSEFPAFIDAAAAAGKPMAQKIKAASRYNMAFGRIDKNGDGFISPEELSSLK